MFDLFRSRTKAVRYVLGALLMLIAVAMVVTLIPGFGTNMGDSGGADKVADISGDTLTVRELQRRVGEYLRRQNVPEGSRQTLAKLMVDAIVAQRSVVFQAKEMGLSVSDEDLAVIIQSAFPELFPDGKFVGNDGYQALVAQREMTIPEFELGMKQKRITDQLTGLITAGTIVTPREIEAEFKQSNLKVGIEYVKLSRAEVEKGVTISDAEARDYYEKNMKGTPIPKSYNLLMLFLTEQRVAAAIPVEEATIRQMYEARRESLMTPERVSVRHILLRTDGASKEAAAKKLAEAQALIKQLRAGANFEELAKKVSEDPGSKDKGGNLGFVMRGQMVKNFEDA
ncbi:MAG: peptidylprolyl isomerase, partial [Bryobacter sp.]|nr:peptidylprolyl isomerase [Bryobacter sp.]